MAPASSRRSLYLEEGRPKYCYNVNWMELDIDKAVEDTDHSSRPRSDLLLPWRFSSEVEPTAADVS
jgi:hypothetical protein